MMRDVKQGRRHIGDVELSGDAGGAEMEDASTFIAENLLSFTPNPELYLLSGFDR